MLRVKICSQYNCLQPTQPPSLISLADESKYSEFTVVCRKTAIYPTWRYSADDYQTFLSSSGVRGGAVGWGTALQAGRSRVRFPMVSLDFSLTYSFQPYHGPGFDSESNRNEYQQHFLGGKDGRCVGLTNLLPSCADCLEFCEPQPPGNLMACPGL
jgi:hypothetical protein